MRWLWVDRIVAFEPGRRIVAVKGVRAAEEHLRDASRGGPGATPLMPGSLIIEGMAQTAGILVGQTSGFREKVVLAKVTRADLTLDVPPGCTLRYTAEIENLLPAGASTAGLVEVLGPAGGPPVEAGRIDLVFSQLDNSGVGGTIPGHNFVFGESFRALVAGAGIAWES